MPYPTNRARRDLEALAEPLRLQARSLVAHLDAEPSLGKGLPGRLQGVRSARPGRSHRILYSAGDSGITVLTIRPRRDAYR